MNKKASFKNSVFPFLLTILFVFSIRWFLFEPFVIPSGSLIPSLLIYDHVLVSKYDFGLRLPWTKTWVANWSEPKVGEIVVFRSKHDDSYFMIKRLIGKAGDRIKMNSQGVLFINDKPLERHKVDLSDPQIIKKYTELAHPKRLKQPVSHVEVYEEQLNGKKYLTMYSRWSMRPRTFEYTVPEGEYFFMGDNRDNSSDSRAWGALKRENLIGKARLVWLSCDSMLSSLPFLCKPDSIRTDRIFMQIN
ncbi:MAG: signal peptidase I [Bdellovibrionales bacterium]|nr:signal peptidase I [Bdellovibrionales bacterium]